MSANFVLIAILVFCLNSGILCLGSKKTSQVILKPSPVSSQSQSQRGHSYANMFVQVESTLEKNKQIDRKEKNLKSTKKTKAVIDSNFAEVSSKKVRNASLKVQQPQMKKERSHKKSIKSQNKYL